MFPPSQWEIITADSEIALSQYGASFVRPSPDIPVMVNVTDYRQLVYGRK